MDRSALFDAIRNPLFGGSLNQKQAEGVGLLLDEVERRDMPAAQAAYILATAYHETARTMQPVEEYGRGDGRAYGQPDPETGHAYYGRGHVQLTWRHNYQRMGDKLGIGLVHQPWLALDPATSVKILFTGMLDGMFTGRALGQYVTPSVVDFHNARRVVNGLDRAATIAGYARTFQTAFAAAGYQAPTAIDWRAFQEWAESAGFDPGPVDGVFGPKTEGALIDAVRADPVRAAKAYSRQLP